MSKQKTQNKKGNKKAGRNKRVPNVAMSAYVRGKITFEQYKRG